MRKERKRCGGRGGHPRKRWPQAPGKQAATPPKCSSAPPARPALRTPSPPARPCHRCVRREPCAELCANYDAGAYCGKPSHFIGHLQTNKIKKVLGRASPSRAWTASICWPRSKRKPPRPASCRRPAGSEHRRSRSRASRRKKLWPLLDAAAAEEHIRVKGLMAIPPVNDDDAQNRRYLAQVYKLFVQAGERYQNVKMETLSMGMSGDFENAIREGATLVRIGTAIAWRTGLFEEVTSQSGLRPPALSRSSSIQQAHPVAMCLPSLGGGTPQA